MGDAMLKMRVTADDIEHGRSLLRMACNEMSAPAVERFMRWQAEHFGCTDRGGALASWKLCILSGNGARAERLFDAVAEPLLKNEWHNRSAARAKLAAGCAVICFVGLVLCALLGGAMYFLRAVLS